MSLILILFKGNCQYIYTYQIPDCFLCSILQFKFHETLVDLETVALYRQMFKKVDNKLVLTKCLYVG